MIPLNTLKTHSYATYGNDTAAYTKPVYERSPLNRVAEQYGPGQDWYRNSKSVKTEYLTNTINGTLDCRRYQTTDIRDAFQLSIQGGKDYYPAGSLYVTRATDEDGNVSYKFTNKRGQLLLSRQMNGSTAHDTYYVYDSYGNLRIVLPPLAADKITTAGASWAESTTAIIHYAYLYKYDTRNRMIGKKLPGCDWITYVYDKADRMVFSQDGEQRIKNPAEWTFYMYDNYNRVALQGTCTNTNTANAASVVIAAHLTTINTGIDNSGYVISNFTLTSPVVNLVNYYDNYSFRTWTGFNNSNFPTASYPGKGFLTGSVTTVLDSQTKLYSANYYNEKGQLVNTVSSNHMGGYDKTTTTYNFRGKPLTITHEHTASGKTDQTQKYTYNYDHAERLNTVTHKLNTEDAVTLASNTYDDLGRLKTRSPHNASASRLTYEYNVRSQPTSIAGYTYNQNLFYNNGNGTPRYNGNISSMTWKSSTEATRGYKFTYDGLNRMNKAVYGEGETITGSNLYGDSLNYDKHGNITYRINGSIGHKSLYYSGNQLTSTGNSTFAYNKNGAMTKYSSKGITSITYNCLNLPKRVTWSATRYTDYLYDAAGNKLQSKYTNGSTVTTTDYCGSVIYENGALGRILTEEGYLTVNGTIPSYYYYLKDHLGNNRVVVNKYGSVEQVTNYYPFGGTFLGHSASLQPYKFGGKELDANTELYDFEARQMDTETGRFTTMDPLAEKYYSVSPYAYCNNNPMRFVDPDGMTYEDYETNAMGDITKKKGGDSIWSKLKAFFSFTIDTRDRTKEERELEWVIEQQSEKSNPSTTESPKPSLTAKAVAGGMLLTTTLVADDVTGVGVIDDVIIPAVWAGVGAVMLYEEITKQDDAPVYFLDATKKKKSSAESTYSTKDKEHTKNQRSSNRNTHEEGRSRNKKDKGGEKGDTRRTRYK